ncbi:acetyltransferase [Trichoderma cornu-damae]|uniref:Acetyltransferase n=1 Tax=Trichoderma cornu-damae TaxID=654480 RepID=A0A9P8TW59_9HYPO|nr:acetyltransferase [Trichoderma cornu-damae]
MNFEAACQTHFLLSYVDRKSFPSQKTGQHFLEPSRLEGFRLGVSREKLPPTIPRAFIDAMEVREEVFVKEQSVPEDNEFDADDPRSCHWVIYVSVNKTEVPEIRSEDGNILRPRKSSTRSTPVGTIRMVPFPHEPHPKPGGDYWNGILKCEEGEEKGGTTNADVPSARPFVQDRPTTFHDGKEPYIKLGRLAVVKDYRGNRFAGLLVRAALDWVKDNPSLFDPSVRELGLEQMGASTETQAPRWGGLVCVHAQEQVASAWAKWGFEIDEDMGKWFEEGIPHVGMFLRLEIGQKNTQP